MFLSYSLEFKYAGTQNQSPRRQCRFWSSSTSWSTCLAGSGRQGRARALLSILLVRLLPLRFLAFGAEHVGAVVFGNPVNRRLATASTWSTGLPVGGGVVCPTHPAPLAWWAPRGPSLR